MACGVSNKIKKQISYPNFLEIVSKKELKQFGKIKNKHCLISNIYLYLLSFMKLRFMSHCGHESCLIFMSKKIIFYIHTLH